MTERANDGSETPVGAQRTPRTRVAFALALLAVALGAGLFAIAFRALLSTLLQHASGHTNVVDAMASAPPWLRLVSPCLGGLCAGTIGLVVARSAQGHGVGDVMEAVVLGRARISPRVTLLKSLASLCAIVSGGSLGREGPLIQFGGALGQWVARRLPLAPGDGRRLVAAGAAAGFAAAYNTPFAAVLFVLEVVAGVVVLDTFVPVVVATVLASQLVRSVVGAGPIYGVRAFALEAPLTLGWFALLGVVGALAAQGFMRLLSAGEQVFQRSGLPLPLRAGLGGLVAGVVIALIPEVAGNGYEPLNRLLDGQLATAAVLVLLVAKCVATTASVSSGSPGGVFTPVLLLGGGIGHVFGAGLTAWLGPTVGPAGGYALVGMAATTAASTHAPLMAAVMAFELSGDYAVVLPLLLATAVATGVSRRLRRDSIYAAELRARGVGWELTMEGRHVAEAPRADAAGPS